MTSQKLPAQHFNSSPVSGFTLISISSALNFISLYYRYRQNGFPNTALCVAWPMHRRPLPFFKGEAIDCPACARRAAPVVQHEAAQLVPPWIRAEVDWRRQHTEVSRSGNGWHSEDT